MWSTRQILMASLFALLGGVAWWLLEQEPEPETQQQAQKRTPDYVATDFTAVETDDAGRPARELEAKQLRQYVDEDLSELDFPRLKLYQADGGPPWLAQSRHGLLLSGGDEAIMREAVQIWRNASLDSRPARLETSELTIWPKRQYAQGDHPVRIQSEQDWLTASGMSLWYAAPARAVFPGRAHLYLAPASQTHTSNQESH